MSADPEERLAYDLIVVGAGTAGIPCAVAAAAAGASVLLVEKAGEIGGSLHISSAQMSAAGTRRQAERGIVDSPDRHFDDVMRINHHTGRADLIRLAIDEAAETVDFLDQRGLDWVPDTPKILYIHEPYTVARTVWGLRGGESVLDVLSDELARWTRPGAVELWLESPVEHLLVDDGAVTGVACRRGGASGPLTEVRAPATVLATGGYAASKRHFSELHDRPLYTVAWPTSTGDGIDLAREVGGRVVGTESWLPTFGGLPGPVEDWDMVWHDRPTLIAQLREQWEIYVLRDGRRFVAEDDGSVDAKERALAATPDLTFFQIFDRRILEDGPQVLNGVDNAEVPALVGRRSGVFRAERLEELAAAAGIDAAGLAATVAEFNAAVGRGGSDVLGRRLFPRPIAEPPFYAVQNHGINLISFGGVDVDAGLAVVGPHGPVQGLYAVGELLGAHAVTGNAFCSGMLATPAISLGRWLGSRLGEQGAGGRAPSVPGAATPADAPAPAAAGGS